MLQRLKEKQVTLLTSTRVHALGKGYADVESASGRRRLKGFDTIVMAVGGEVPDTAVYKSIQGKVSELYRIGDAVEPREIMDAIYEGEEIALKL